MARESVIIRCELAHSCARTLAPAPSQRLCPKAESSRNKKRSQPEGGSQCRTSLSIPRPAGGALKGLGASRCNLHLSLSRLPPGAGRQGNEPPSPDGAPRGARTGGETTYKELLLALGVSFQNCIRQLCRLTRNKPAPFQVGSPAWGIHALGQWSLLAFLRACPERAHSPSSSASSTPCSTSAALCAPAQGNSRL